MIICSKKLPESNLLAVINTYARACVNAQADPEAAECRSYRSAVINEGTVLNPAKDVGMVSGRQMTWEQSREGCERSLCSMEVEITEQKRGRAAGRAQGSGNCRAGRKALYIRLQSSVVKPGDVWIKLVMLLCARENSTERH